eukprot:TRINITY_DN4629_c0_g1_i1.p1 TRINITY_DN4629_c0_g1~~TRINITY_DN4629_c0_g1_i1.p1  ORF type:complete len:518 (+),score=134.40 TRINITY_DN4629_c0_g1_i1:96-1649(+)
MAEIATAMYDFEGDTQHGELSFPAGAKITILNKDIGDGWWEGQYGSARGLFPESYVEVGDDSGSDWDDSDDDDDDWGDGPTTAAAPPAATSKPFSQPQVSAGTTLDQSTQARSATLKKSVNRFSVFVKAGAESYLLGATKELTIDSRNVLHMTEGPDGPCWVRSTEPYGAIQISHSGARTKFKGLKSYEAYNIMGARPGVEVERRYKHFQWLHERLTEKYSCVCVPPLPSKEYETKFGESAITKRQDRLGAWLNRVARHPILSSDRFALEHFLVCSTSDKNRWKNGKRDAEKDQFVGAQFFKLISQDASCPNDSDKEIDQFSDFVVAFTKATKRNIEIAKAHADKMHSAIRREYTKIGAGFKLLSEVFSQGGGQVKNGNNVRLAGAFAMAAGEIEGIAELWANQPVHDQIPWMEGLKEYAGLVTQFSGCISSSRSASVRLDEIQNNEEASPDEKDAVKKRCDIIHSLTLCEMAHFHEQRRSDFKDMMKAYLQAKIDFHNKIVQKLESAKNHFDQLQF